MANLVNRKTKTENRKQICFDSILKISGTIIKVALLFTENDNATKPIKKDNPFQKDRNFYLLGNSDYRSFKTNFSCLTIHITYKFIEENEICSNMASSLSKVLAIQANIYYSRYIFSFWLARFSINGRVILIEADKTLIQKN